MLPKVLGYSLVGLDIFNVASPNNYTIDLCLNICKYP